MPRPALGGLPSAGALEPERRILTKAADGLWFRAICISAVVLAPGSAILSGCAKPPSSDECRAAIIHMMEVQLDSPEFRQRQEQAASAGSAGQSLSSEQMQASTQWLKSQIPSLVKPEFVSQCVKRMKASDIQCTLSATTTTELVDKCHWKVVSGAKGAALGF